MKPSPRIVPAVIPGQAVRFYLIDQNLDFIPEVKELVDQKANTRHAPGTTRLLCYRLRWYYRFLYQRQLAVLDAKPTDLSDFMLWLSTPYREGGTQPNLLQASTINQILYAVASLYKALIRRGRLTESPVLYEEVRRHWSASVDDDLLAHTRQGSGRTVQRMELRVKEPKTLPKTVSPEGFAQFINRIHVGNSPNTDPSGFRDRLMVLLLKESGLRCDEMLGLRLEDIDFSANGVHVRFRPDNENGARAKAGYGRDRFVHLPPELFGLLDLYLTEVWVNANYRSDYLWLVLKRNAVNGTGQSTFGSALTKGAVNQTFVYYSKQAGIKIHPHMLRHTHATELVRSYLKAGESVDWKFIADRLGHSSVVTTMETYVHLTREDNKESYKMYLKKKKEADAKRCQSDPSRAAMEYNPANLPRPAAKRRKSAAQ